MNSRRITKRVNSKPICIGTGLVALDVILNGKPETPAKLYAGGSCGNVLTILSYLGWESYPIARLAQNNATKEVLGDLKKWEVKTNFISQKLDGSTPIIIHRILKDKQGNPKHRFEFKHPETKKWLPNYKPVLSNQVDDISSKFGKCNVFYFDRINRSSIEFAKITKASGALVVFEPSSIGDLKLFKEALEVANIVKFSNQRIKNYQELFPIAQAELEIETLGQDGLRYRYSKSMKSKSWKEIKPYRIQKAIDSAGAGDWCTAGLIHKLGCEGISILNNITSKEIESVLKYGQALGAINCMFDGARGIMYNMEIKELERIISRLYKNEKIVLNLDDIKLVENKRNSINNLSITSLL